MPKAKPARRPEMKRRGDAAEIAFLQKASSQGLRVSKPYGDSDRYDFIVDNGTHRWRIQVKSTGRLLAEGKYHINARRCLNLVTVAYLKSEVDFIAFYVTPEDSWHIVPVKALYGRQSVTLSSLNDPKNGIYGEFCEAWHLLKRERRDSK